ncbi:MAG: hypothetical protein PHF36_04570 [Candidatus Cloacimonetes bacterium]|nr:hypothetical protein [Candidatus Cloacimonadota bacterium]
MKKHLLVIFAILMLLFTACSEKDDKNPTGPTDPIVGNPPAMALTADYVFEVPHSVDDIDAAEFVDIPYGDGTTRALPLTYFITKELTDEIINNNRDDETQGLFAYHLKSTDGMTSRKNGDPDMFWADFKEGYLLPDESHRSFFESDAIENVFNVKFLGQIELFRSVQVVKPNGELVLFEMNALETEEIADYYDEMDQGIKLKDFITEYITDQPQNYIYKLVANDGYDVAYTWELIEDGYWLKNAMTTIFPTFGEDMTGAQKKFKKLMQIKLELAE